MWLITLAIEKIHKVGSRTEIKSQNGTHVQLAPQPVADNLGLRRFRGVGLTIPQMRCMQWTCAECTVLPSACYQATVIWPTGEP